LSQDGNSLIVSLAEQNIRLHTHPGLDQSLAAGGRRIEVLPGWPQGANACGIFCGTVLGNLAEALSGKHSDAMI
jgi:hypothetical protein